MKAKTLRPSSVLPERAHDSAIGESVKRDGVQTPVIVRKVAGSEGYEIVDGQGRVESLDPEEDVLVEVRSDLTDAGVFRLAEATFKRTQRSTYENALFYAKYLETVKKETGEKGAQAKVANEAGIDKSLLSQYLTIHEMFTKLSQLSPDAKFESLKRLGTNKLYELSRLTDNPKLLEVAAKVDQTDEISTEGVHQMVQEIVDASIIDLPESPKPAEAASTPSIATESPAVVVEKNNDPVSEDPASKDTGSKFEDMLNKLSSMAKDLDKAVSNIKTQTPSLDGSSSLKTLRTVEKISTGVRRLLYYLRRLNATFERGTS